MQVACILHLLFATAIPTHTSFLHGFRYLSSVPYLARIANCPVEVEEPREVVDGPALKNDVVHIPE